MARYSVMLRFCGEGISGILVGNVEGGLLRMTFPSLTDEDIIEEDSIQWVGEVCNRLSSHFRAGLLIGDMETRVGLTAVGI